MAKQRGMVVSTIVSMTLAAAICIPGVGQTVTHAQPATAHKWVIALANSYYGNTWRHQMVQSFEAAAKQAKAQGLIADYVIENGDGTQNQQLSQLNDLILKHVDAIAIDAASPTALNGVLERAAAAGIKVVAFDSIATAPHAYKLDFNFTTMGELPVQYVADRLHGKGNIVFIRGVAGSAPDHILSQGWQTVLSKYPGLKTVATVYGQATTSIAAAKLSAVLPSLGKVDAIVGEGGGDSYGAVQAIQSAHLSFPIITGDGDAEFIHWWIGQSKKTGYQTYSVNSQPGCGSAAFWVTLEVLNGKTVPQHLSLPLLEIRQSNLPQFGSLAPNSIASQNYTKAWVDANLLHLM